MAIIDLYSRRKRRAEAGEQDVYDYDAIPTSLRAQVEHILEDAVGPYWEARGYGDAPPHNNNGWHFIRNQLCREKGRRSLANDSNAHADVIAYLYKEENVDEWLDLIELSFRYIAVTFEGKQLYELKMYGIQQSPNDAIEELNERFKNASFGYQIENLHIVRVDNFLLHAEVVKPVLRLLSDKRFAGAEAEYLAAHAHFRAGEYRDAIVDANNAFESTLKSICDIKKWAYPAGARVGELLRVVRAHSLFPTYLDKSFDQLTATLKSGLPEVRNNEGSHGQGSVPTQTPEHIAGYALHLAAAQIVFLVECLQEWG